MLILQSQSVTSGIATNGERNFKGSFSVGSVHFVTSIGHDLNSIAIPSCLWFRRRNDGNVVSDLLTGAYHQIVQQMNVERRSDCNKLQIM